MIVPPGSSSAQASVLIVLWNCAGFVGPCLRSLAEDPVPVEVLCFDNASADGSADVAEHAGVTVIRSPVNVGFPRAVNELWPLATSRACLLLNPDVVLEPGTLARCLGALDEPAVGLVGANLRFPDGGPDLAAARRYRSLATIAVESLGLLRLVPRLNLQYLSSWDRTTSRDVPCINGAFALLRTETLKEIGGLDESVFMYLEDQELCRAVSARGERIRFVAEARAVHAGSGPTLAATSKQRAVANLHRLDASLEIVRRRQGRVARLAALVVLLLRAAVSYLVTGRHADQRLKYGSSLRWLLRQWRRRVPPPPVP